MRRPVMLALALVATALSASTAHATPVATNDAQYTALGRIFPDPLAGCVQGGPAPCSPNAQGNTPALQFIGVDEFIDAIEFMNSKPEWQRYLEVLPLDGRMGANDGDAPPAATPAEAFPGNNLPSFGFTPRTEYKSVGLPTTTRDRNRSDIYMLRVTDESVPDDQKQTYVTSLSIHGIERAGIEGGTRAAEDLVTAYTAQANDGRLKADTPIVPDGTIPNAPTFGDVLKKAIVYFTYPNPDGWRRGSVTAGGVFFQRYNGNGVDLNRDWPDVGFSFRPYSTGSEPEVRALGSALQEIDGRKPVDAGVDLHGMLTADALSYTLIGHGRHDWAKDTRIRETARNIHVVSEQALKWSPLIVPNNTDKDTMGCVAAEGVEACRQIYGQTWGTVYDTINYTVTGSLGDWLDSPFGIGADGLDNEMAFSHLDRNIVFDPQGEQLHVDGNKGLIYAQLASMLNPPDQRYTAPGLKGYVANTRKTRKEEQLQPKPPAGTVAQAKIVDRNGTPSPDGIVFDFPVKSGPQPAGDPDDGGKNVYNGGLRVDITKLNAQGISDGSAITTLKVQCKFCDDHPGVPPEDEWVTVAEDYNQSPAYAQAGLTAAVNRPQVETQGKKVEWRAVLAVEGGPPSLVDAGSRMDVEFFQGEATLSRDSSGFNPSSLEGYDVANTDLFEDLNGNIADPNQRFRRIDPAAIAAGRQNLDSFTSIVLSDLVPGRDAFLDKLQGWVRDGGNLVLTDSALRLLPEYVDLDAKTIADRKMYLGQVSFQTADGADDAADIKHPLATRPYPVAQLGARFNSGLRRQVYEPVPLGFAIEHPEDTEDNSVGDNFAASPAWDVEREALEQNAGAKTAATAVEAGPDGSGVELDRTSVGEAVVGKGRVRFIGALAPQPSQEFDHDFGIEPYSLTYTGHLLLRNALEWPARPIQPDAGEGPGVAAGGGAAGGGGPIACTASSRGFRKVDVRGAGARKLRIGFERRIRQPITVDVFQTSRGRSVLQERLVARFRGKFESFTWNEKGAFRKRKIRDGYYFVRLRMNLGASKADYRRVTLRRQNGRWVRRPPHYRKESCSLLTSYKLLRPVFGGRGGRAVTASFRLTRRARAGLTVMRGRRVLSRSRMRVRGADITHRIKLSSRGLPRGDYRFVLRVRPLGGGRTIRAVLTSRRI
jgi:hypothetical protein